MPNQVQEGNRIDSKTSRVKSPIRLDPPGAGLPLVQRVVLRYFLFPLRTKKESWESVDRRIQSELAKIFQILESIKDPQVLTVPKLVNPILGLEDSSRFWSISETLEHLQIVGEGQLQIMRDLHRGVRPQLEIDIAKVKPKGRSGEAPLAQFKKFSDALLKEVLETPWNRKVKVTQRHPWFGEITLKQWHWLVAAHFWIHRQQLKQIAAQF